MRRPSRELATAGLGWRSSLAPCVELFIESGPATSQSLSLPPSHSTSRKTDAFEPDTSRARLLYLLAKYLFITATTLLSFPFNPSHHSSRISTSEQCSLHHRLYHHQRRSYASLPLAIHYGEPYQPSATGTLATEAPVRSFDRINLQRLHCCRHFCPNAAGRGHHVEATDWHRPSAHPASE